MTIQLSNSPCGRLVPISNGNMAFVPDPMPRLLDLPLPLVNRLDEASRAVATLSGVGETIPNPSLLIRPLMRREAVLSSRIEGTQASLDDLFRFEATGLRRPKGDVAEVFNYVSALEEGIGLLEQLPISLRLINHVHAVLMQGVRGQEKYPGQLRTGQVWIGAAGTPIEQARFVPPPPHLLMEAIGDWERFANETVLLPPLVQCALLHYQFEAIHPYLDGNGRIGRLLIALFLYAKGVLRTPLLYLSAYFEADRQAYYDQLLRVSATGDWSTWLEYFLTGVTEQATDALFRTRQLREMHDRYRSLLQESRESINAVRLVDEMFAMPFMTAPQASRVLGITTAGARRVLDRLAERGLVKLSPGSWPRLYVADELLEALQ